MAHPWVHLGQYPVSSGYTLTICTRNVPAEAYPGQRGPAPGVNYATASALSAAHAKPLTSAGTVAATAPAAPCRSCCQQESARGATLHQTEWEEGFLVAPASDAPERWGDRLERWIERLYAAVDGFGVRRGWLPPPPEPAPELSQGPLDGPVDLPAELFLDLESLLAGYAPRPAMRPTARQHGSKVHVEIIFGAVSSLGCSWRCSRSRQNWRTRRACRAGSRWAPAAGPGCMASWRAGT
jgi:hypothetical protein